MNKKTQGVASFIFGVIGVGLMLYIAFLTPNPTDFQYAIFRIVISLAAAGVVAAYPGFIEVKFGNWLRAGGALAVFAIVYNVNPASLNASNIDSGVSAEKLQLGLDSTFMHEHTYVYSVARPLDEPPRVYKLATWQRIILNNQGKEPINITDLSLEVNGERTASDMLDTLFFEEAHLKPDELSFSMPVRYPIKLEPKEIKYLYAAIPTEVPQLIGEVALNVLHDKESRKDSIIELLLFGNEPDLSFDEYIPVTVNGREEYLEDGSKLAGALTYNDLIFFREIAFKNLDNVFSQVGNYKYDDGFKMMRTTKLFNLISKKLSERNLSIRNQESPIKKAVLLAKTSLDEVFSVVLKPSPTLIKMTKA